MANPVLGGYTIGTAPVKATTTIDSKSAATITFTAALPTPTAESEVLCVVLTSGGTATSIDLKLSTNNKFKLYHSGGSTASTTYHDDRLQDVTQPHIYTLRYQYNSGGTSIYQDGVLVIEGTGVQWSDGKFTGEAWFGGYKDGTLALEGMEVYSSDIVYGVATTPSAVDADEVAVSLYSFDEGLEELAAADKLFFATNYPAGATVPMPSVTVNGAEVTGRAAVDMAIVFGAPVEAEIALEVADFVFTRDADGNLTISLDATLDPNPLAGHSVTLVGADELDGVWTREKVNATGRADSLSFGSVGQKGGDKGFYRVLIERGQQKEGSMVVD